MGHLNAERLARLLARPQDESALYEHLGQGCDECEAFLATADHPLLDGATDVALLSIAPAPAAGREDPRAEPTFRRVRGAPAPSRRWLVALAAMLLAVVALFLLRPRADDGIKGPPAVTLEVEAVVRDGAGTLTRVERGARVASSGTLLIRYHAAESGSARLVLVRAGQREVIGEVQLEAGTHDLMRDGSLLGISLEGEGGRLAVRLEAVHSTAEVEVDVGP